MIEYIKLFWEGAPEGEPAVILYEVDTENERLALRSIDIFADCRTRNIPDLYDGVIEITPIPTVEELNAHVWGGEFHACVIEKAEFEAIWESRTHDGKQVAGNGKHTKTNEFFKDTQLHEMNGGATEDGMDRANQAKTPLQGAF